MVEKQQNRGGVTDDDLDFLEELGEQSIEQLRRKRLHERVSVRTRIILRPGNSSDLLKLKVQGMTSDLSSGGCRALFPVPIKVGDIYRLEFHSADVDVPMVFARCLRCRLIREDAFETGFSFFSQISLAERRPSGSEGDLLG